MNLAKGPGVIMPHAMHARHADTPKTESAPTPARLTLRERAQKGISARLETESWDDMTAAARGSDNHVSSLARWRRIAAEKNPHLRPEQLDRLAERLRSEFFRAAARKRWDAQQAAA